MSKLNLRCMQSYLSQSITSKDRSDLSGLLVNIDFRHYLASMRLSDQFSGGGLVVRSINNIT
jgi:hypothetical protein